MSKLHSQLSADGRCLQLQFCGDLDIAAAAQLRQALLGACADTPATQVALDLGAVERADSAGVQLLLALTRQLRDSGRSGHVTACSPALRRVASVLGCSDEEQVCGLPLLAVTAVGSAALAESLA